MVNCLFNHTCGGGHLNWGGVKSLEVLVGNF